MILLVNTYWWGIRAPFNGETDALAAEKFAVALAAGLIPVLCVGETLAEREAGNAEVVAAQMAAVLAALKGFSCQGGWGHGVGLGDWGPGGTAAQRTSRRCMPPFVRRLLVRMLQQLRVSSILYGGSVKPSNAVELWDAGYRWRVDRWSISGGGRLHRDLFCRGGEGES